MLQQQTVTRPMGDCFVKC